jgi:glycosyltransferase involved in cell wall biosynthesis
MISFIIPCRNERDHIVALLDSLRAQDYRAPWEAIIADGQSSDGTRAILDNYSSKDNRIRVIDNPALSVSAGLNRAIDEAQGDIILRMDAHTEYASDYVRRCVQALEDSGAANVGGPARTKASGLTQRAVAAAYHSRFSTGGAKFHDENYEGYVDTVPYGCWKKSVLQEAGLFDETFVRNQDDELNLRLVRRGGRIWQSPSIVSWYRPRNSFAKLFRQYFQYGFWKVEVIRKHRIPASWRHIVPGMFVVGNLALLLGAATAYAAGALVIATILAALLATGLTLYAVAALVASVAAARSHGWILLPMLPVVFATYHVSYGLGFLINAVMPQKLSPNPARPHSIFTSVTR